MPKNIISTLGVLVALLPFLSIPSTIRNPIFIILGISIAVIGYQERHNRRMGLIGHVIRRGKKVVDAAAPVNEGAPLTSDIKDETARNVYEKTDIENKQ